ncbi:MAG: cytochrome c3 family protein [Deferrisomatales bacterium]|nr:cytochrome c3 family protein [Deferrisomatales bacterium]
MNCMQTGGPLLCLLLLALWAAVPASHARTVVLHPVDGSVVDEGGGQIVGFCDDPGTAEVEITLNGATHRVELWDGVFDLDLDWAEGPNELRFGTQTIHFTSDPYAETLRKPAVHQAMLDNCANCHVLGAERSLSLIGAAAELCRGCHAEVAAAVVHGAGECDGCHAPHTAWNPKLLLRTDNQLCLGCHADRTGEEGVAHRALWGELTCTTCHEGHRPTLSGVGRHCGACHQGVVAAGSGHQEAVNTGCQVCHTMHGTAGQGLWKDPAESCHSCHPLGGDLRHDPALAACGDCHRVHGEKEMPPSGERCRGCHGALLEKNRLHGPDALGRCEICHPLHQMANRSPAVFSCTGCHGTEKLQGGHTGTVVGFDTCLQCHHLHQSDEPFFLPAVQHEPFRERDCADCHEYPGFDERRKLSVPWGELCAQCHDELPASEDRHGPVAEGRCQDCHAPHASRWPAHLRQGLQRLCLACHPRGEEPGAAADRPHIDRQLCSDCHEPHGGPHQHYLTAEGNALCTGCHSDPTLDLGGVLKPIIHGPLNTVGCGFCHDPHDSPGGRHLRLPVAEMCASCHEELSPASLGAAGATVHRPVAEGHCTACHRPHAGPDKALLRSGGNGLCQGCHDPKRHRHTLVPRIDSAFASVAADWPRDGEALACRGCHLPHSGDGKGLFVRPREELCKTCHGGI